MGITKIVAPTGSVMADRSYFTGRDRVVLRHCSASVAVIALVVKLLTSVLLSGRLMANISYLELTPRRSQSIVRSARRDGVATPPHAPYRRRSFRRGAVV
jgi:hypothetical protein